MDSADAHGPRRTQAWMGPAGAASPEAAGPASTGPASTGPAPAKALRWMPKPGELPSYPAGTVAPTATPAPAAAPAAPPLSTVHVTGEVVGGRYRLKRPIGHGELTETWEAAHVDLERAVAIKFLRQQAVGMGEQMLEVARAVARVRHPHVVEFSDFGRLDSGDPYFVMELLSGQTLEKLIAGRGTVAWARAVNIAQQISLALAAAHQQGIVHRDLRPGNVFLVETGEVGDFVKVVDFGLARGTRIGGTPAYMSPEQCRNEQLDPRSDVYALGCLLFTMITGEPPFVGDPDTMRWRQINEAPKSLRDRAPRQFIPDELEAIVTRCLAKLPARRFADSRELGAALAELANFAAAASVAGAAIPDPSASGSRPMGFAGRPAPKSPEELTNSYKPVNAQIIDDEPEPEDRGAPAAAPTTGLSVGAVVGIVFATLLVAAGVGLGAWWLVTTMIQEQPGPSQAVESGSPEGQGEGQAEDREAATAPAAADGATPDAPGPEPEPSATPPASEPATDEAAPSEKAATNEASAPTDPKPAKPSSKPAKADEPESSPEPAPEPAPPPKQDDKPSLEPDSKANKGIGHDELVDPWN